MFPCVQTYGMYCTVCMYMHFYVCVCFCVYFMWCDACSIWSKTECTRVYECFHVCMLTCMTCPQLSQGRESELDQQLEGVQQADEELRSRLTQLEEDKRALSRQLQEARGTLISCPCSPVVNTSTQHCKPQNVTAHKMAVLLFTAKSSV